METLTMPTELTRRNGYIFVNGLKIVRGGLGEFLMCLEDNTCIQVRRSYDAAIAYARNYDHAAVKEGV